MNTVHLWLQQPFMFRLGWTLIHFLWQGSAIGLLLALAQFSLRRRAAQTRYLAGCAALAIMLIAPLVTFICLTLAPRGVTDRDLIGIATGTTFSPVMIPLPNSLSALSESSSNPARNVPWLVIAWLFGVCALSVRLVGGWLQLRRLPTRQTEKIGEPWLDRLEDFQQRLGLSRSVQLFKSALVEVPTVIGWLRPVILLPASTITGLTPAQLESVLAHELAHVRRNDYLVNLIQCAVETLLFYHPAVWWVSKRIRDERELCCDDMVVQVCGDRLSYARALASLEQLRLAPCSVALAATNGSLGNRIRRLIQKSPDEQKRNWRRPVALLAVGITLVLLTASPGLVFKPKIYASTVRLSIAKDPDRSDIDGTSRNGTTSFDPYWIQTEFEKIKSKLVLNRVIEGLRLNEKWARRAGADSQLKMPETFQRLIKQMEVRQFPNTSLIQITVHSEDPREAAEIANAIAREYADMRESGLRHLSSSWISALQQQLKNQKEELYVAGTRMDELRSSLGVIESANGEPFTTIGPEMVLVFERNRAEVEVKLANFESLLNKLKKMPRDQLANSIPALSYPDPRLTELLSQLDLAETQRAHEIETLGEEHAKVLAINGTIKKTKEQIDTRLTGILSQLEIEVERNREQLDFLTMKISEARRLHAETAEKCRPYFEAKREYEIKQRAFETLELRVRRETTGAQIPKHTSVQIVDPAEPALRPVRGWF